MLISSLWQTTQGWPIPSIKDLGSAPREAYSSSIVWLRSAKWPPDCQTFQGQVIYLLSDCLSVIRPSACPWHNSAVGISEWLNNFYTWQKHIPSVDLRLIVLDKLNSSVCQRTRLEKSLVWTPFSAVRSLVPRLLLPKWPAVPRI